MNESDVNKGCNIFYRLMKNELNLNEHSILCKNFIPRCCNKLHINKQTEDVICTLSNKVDESNILSNYPPSSIVAGCIYYISVMLDLRLNKQMVAKNCNLTVPTVDNVYKILQQHNSQLI